MSGPPRAAVYDPDVAAVIATAAALGRKPMFLQSVAEARETYRQACAATALPMIAMTVSDLVAPTPATDLRIRIYRPADHGRKGLPALVYYHGGGWVIGDLETHDTACRHLATAAQCCVAAVEYRLAPEHVFPAAVDDAVAAYAWIAENAAVLRIDRERIGVAGDSAGASLATVVALTFRTMPTIRPRVQVLFYPVTDLSTESDGYRRVAHGVPFVSPTMRWFRDHYTPNNGARDDWRASPLRAPSLEHSPPTFILTVKNDPLCEEGQAYAERLSACGVRVWHLHMTDQIHSMLTLGNVLSAMPPVLTFAASMARLSWREG